VPILTKCQCAYVICPLVVCHWHGRLQVHICRVHVLDVWGAISERGIREEGGTGEVLTDRGGKYVCKLTDALPHDKRYLFLMLAIYSGRPHIQ
jgi:hypothetical protein